MQQPFIGPDDQNSECPCPPLEERLLAEAYGVRVISDGLTGTDYRGYYAETKERLEALLS